jgi:hypothetical protein
MDEAVQLSRSMERQIAEHKPILKWRRVFLMNSMVGFLFIRHLRT